MTQRRLFFSLPLPDQVRCELSSPAQSIRLHHVRYVAADNLHLTLVFVGNVGPSKTSLLREAACAVAGEVFDITLDRLGSFSRPGWRGWRRVFCRWRSRSCNRA
ncbi:MAG: hypothetical protein CMO26_07545 [Thiotrichales bacterium]|nr:hypothetical protein [Thiotrichales bacterium]